MQTKELWSALQCDPSEDAHKQKLWSGRDPRTQEWVQARVELLPGKVKIEAWKQAENETAKKEMLSVWIGVMGRDQNDWDLLSARVNGQPSPLRLDQALSLFVGMRAGLAENAPSPALNPDRLLTTRKPLARAA